MKEPPMRVDWPRFCEVIHASNNVILTSHIRPDCDALGSCLGMAGLLESLGKKVRIVYGQEIPEPLHFIDPDKRIQCIGKDIAEADLADADLLIILDTSAWIQLGDMADVIRNSTCKKIIFDHHEGEDDIDAELFKNTTAEAVGRMIVEAAGHLDVSITPQIAQPVLAALATDTGWFRFDSVGPGTFRAAAQLIESGAQLSKLYGDLYERETIGRVRLRGIVLARIEAEFNGLFAHTYIKPEDYEQAGALPTDTDNLINLALEIEGTRFATILVGQVDGGYKMSFRSRCDVAANEVAKQFGGGGHRAAAGAFIDNNNFEEVRTQVLSKVREMLTAGGV